MYLPPNRERVKVPSSGPQAGKRWARRGGTEALIFSVRQEMIQFVASNRKSICWNSETSKFLETGMDVKDHELLARELRRREAYLAEAQRLSQTGSFGWNPLTGEIVWSDETFRIFEFTPHSHRIPFHPQI
jgi:hypothetical protein